MDRLSGNGYPTKFCNKWHQTRYIQIQWNIGMWVYTASAWRSSSYCGIPCLQKSFTRQLTPPPINGKIENTGTENAGSGQIMRKWKLNTNVTLMTVTLRNHQTLRLDNVCGYSAAESCTTMNCAEVYTMNCERNVTYTCLTLHVQLLIAPKVWQPRIQPVYFMIAKKKQNLKCQYNVKHENCQKIALYTVLQMKTTNSNNNEHDKNNINNNNKKLSWCWQTRATPSAVSQGHQT